jgi:hypothetical protein
LLLISTFPYAHTTAEMAVCLMFSSLFISLHCSPSSDGWFCLPQLPCSRFVPRRSPPCFLELFDIQFTSSLNRFLLSHLRWNSDYLRTNFTHRFSLCCSNCFPDPIVPVLPTNTLASPMRFDLHDSLLCFDTEFPIQIPLRWSYPSAEHSLFFLHSNSISHLYSTTLTLRSSIVLCPLASSFYSSPCSSIPIRSPVVSIVSTLS